VYSILALNTIVYIQPIPVHERWKKNTFPTGRIHQNELATPISLKQQFSTCPVTNLSGDIISQETTQDKFLAQYDSSPPFTFSPLQKDLTSNSGFDELLHLCRNTVDLCRTQRPWEEQTEGRGHGP
jgi:hypothetical protein